MTSINSSSFLYHIFPLGACGAERTNDFFSPPVPRLRQIHGWLDHVQSLGADTLFLGPVFESGSHGYDTANSLRAGPAPGNPGDLAALSRDLHQRGMRLVLDGVLTIPAASSGLPPILQTHGADSACRIVQQCPL